MVKKKKTVKKALSKKNKKAASKPGRSILWRLFKMILLLGIIVTAGCAAYVFYLSFHVQERFAGRRWQVPSTVYSDASVFYPGRGIHMAGFHSKLKRLGYRKVAHTPDEKGQWQDRPGGLAIYLHDLDMPGRNQPGRNIVLTVHDSRVAGIQDLNTGEQIPVVEIEPEEIMQFFGKDRERRDLVSFSEVPEHMVQALMAAEDTRFYTHWGIDPIGLGRAILTNLKSGRLRQGGSTLTQQLAKNYFLTHERTFTRKIHELFISLAIEIRFEKNEIMEMYLNEIYFGQKGSVSINGIGEASQFYFDKPVSRISLEESAALAGMIKGPNIYSPYKNPDKCKKRRNQVLAAMGRNGWISEAVYKRSAAQPVRAASYVGYQKKAPYFMDYVTTQLKDLYPSATLTSMGYSIFTTLDIDVQRAAERALKSGLERLEKERPGLKKKDKKKQLQGAVIVIQPRTGNILAMVGGRDYRTSQFNRITQARRQPGSCFKPIVAAAALDMFRPSDLFSNEKKVYKIDGKSWVPSNFSSESEPVVSMRDMLVKSHNRAAVDLAVQTGLQHIKYMAGEFGFTTPLKKYPSMALGSFEVKPLELARAYCAFAADGIQPYPLTVRGVEDENGSLLMRKHVDIRSVISPEKAFLMTDMLSAVAEEGTARSLKYYGIDFPVAAKTGTTNDYRDAWFVGYTPDFLALVWVGFDNGDPVYSTGGKAALPIWADLVKHMPAHVSENPFTMPPGVIQKRVCRESGELAASMKCADTYNEYFLENNQPETICPIHKEAGAVEGFMNKMKDLFN